MNKLPRPKVVGGINVRVETGCGKMYIQMGWCYGKLFEVFATLGRGGGCAMGFSEALTRSITAGLRCGVPPSEYAKQLRGVLCPSPRPFPREDAVMSCPDAIGKVIREYGSLPTEDIVKLIIELSEIVPLEEGNENDEEAANAAKQIEEMRKGREEQDL